MSLVAIGGWAFRAETLRGLLPAGCGSSIHLVNPYPPQKVHQALGDVSNRGRPLAIVGWSLGAMLAIEYAARQPGKVAQLVLLSPTARFCSAPGYRWGKPASEVRALKLGLRRNRDAALTRFYQLCFAPETVPHGKINEHLQEMAAVSDEALLAGLDYLEREDLRGSLASVRAEVVVIHGAEDTVVPHQASAALAATLSGPIRARIVVEGAGHALPITRTAILRTVIATFLG